MQDQVVRAELNEWVRVNHGTKAAAARALGISKSYLVGMLTGRLPVSGPLGQLVGYEKVWSKSVTKVQQKSD